MKRRQAAVSVSCLLIATALLFLRASAGSAETSSRPALDVLLFASSTCLECKQVKDTLIPELKEKYGGAVRFTHIPVDDVEPFKLQLLYEKKYGTKNEDAFKIFVGQTCLCGEKEIAEKLPDAVATELANGSVTPMPDQVRAEFAGADGGESADDAGAALALDRFRELKPAVVAAAGLLDGINPCAFTTLVFFISLLTALKKGRRQIALVGLTFALFVFLTYFALGLGVCKTLKVLSVNRGVATALTLGVAALTLVFAAYSFYDFAMYRRTGDGKDITLKLPDKIRSRVRRIISRQMRTRNLVIGAAALGVVVSILESLCTGQIYLPTIMCISRDPALAGQAFVWLAFYNFMFILPLLGVFALAYFGVSSERMAAFSRKNVGVSKFLLGLLFLGLSVLLLASNFA